MLGVTIAAGLLRGSLARLAAATTSSTSPVIPGVAGSVFMGVEDGSGAFFGVLAGDGGTLAAPDLASSLAASWRLLPAAIAARATWF